MDQSPTSSQPLLLLFSPPGDRRDLPKVPAGVAIARCLDMSMAIARDADALLLGTEHINALPGLVSAYAGVAACPPVIALAEDEASGLAAVRLGADAWVAEGDREALMSTVRSCQARRLYRASADGIEPPNRDLLFELAGSPVTSGQVLATVRGVLARAIEAIPSVDAGSVLLEGSDSRFHFIAAEGFELSKLRQVTFARHELSIPEPVGHVGAHRLFDIAGAGSRLDVHRRRRLRAALGKRVRATLVVPITVAGRLKAVLYLDALHPQVDPAADLELAEEFRAQLTLVLERGEFVRELRGTRDASLRTVGMLLECRDLETKGHTDRVVALAERLAEHLGLGQEQRQALRWGAYLHDIGKIALPDRILFKPGRLTEGEFALVQKHSDIGFEMISDLYFLPPEARKLVRHHHERWDGGGYPDRLAGNEIPLLARVFSMVDVFDALLSQRPYKPAWPRERALETVRRGAGTTFDPELADAFLGMLEGEPGSWAGAGVSAIN